jgi:pyruvate,orthophosphate dikinase
MFVFAGGDNESVQFCHGVGADYTSCSAFRIPTARLGAAKAAVAADKQEKHGKH